MTELFSAPAIHRRHHITKDLFIACPFPQSTYQEKNLKAYQKANKTKQSKTSFRKQGKHKTWDDRDVRKIRSGIENNYS